MVPRMCAAPVVKSASAATWVEKPFVVATAISGPALVYILKSASFAMEEPTTFTMPKTFAPSALASCSAAFVSAVSPDWEMMMTRVLSSMMGSE